MRYLKYITLLVAFIMATSCTESDIIEKRPANSKNKIQVVARVMPFADHDVSSRAIKEGEETNIASIWLAIFNGQKCENLLDDSDTVFEIDATNLREGYDLYIFANVDLSGFKTRLNDDDTENDPKLDDFLTYPIPVEGIVIPEFEEVNCFPMMGVLESENINLENNIIEIPLYALYSKIVMNIEVRPDQAIPGELPARFRLDGYKVYNVPERVDFVGGTIGSTNDGTAVSISEYEVNIEGNQWAQGAKSIDFSFYLPERFLYPKTPSQSFAYPFPKENGSYRAQDSIYMQRFKPELVKDNDPPATFVRFFGEFIDHQGHNYDVSYDIYVGNDSYSNFDVERNTQYNNYITIKGISNSLDQSGTIIALDHRVNVKRVNPIVINLRRETLLDSHFEVRPLRIRRNDSFMGEDLTNARVKVEVIYDDDDTEKNWIGLERSFGDGKTENSTTYLVASELPEGRKNAEGKRKYFTTNLTIETLAGSGEFNNSDGTSLKGGQTIIVPVDDECIWIYVDECTQTGDDVRSATIRISYALDGENYAPDQSIDYVINQRMLFPVACTNGNTYHIEYYEEYLHNYDAEDSYGQTKEEGMPWGLDGVQLSKKYYSFDPDLTPGVDWDTYETKATRPFYDFYIKEHDSFASSNGGTVREYPGQVFTNEIAQNVNADIKYLTMAEQASSAVEYCYNRNKRKPDGTVTVEWYLPSADELEDFIVPAYGTFKEFQDNYYWTSQPAYIRNIFYYENGRDIASPTVYDDNTEYARATKVVRKDGEFEYVKSGLNTEPDPFVDRTQNGYTNLGYFYQMHYWKGSNDYGPVKEGTQTGGDERYTTGVLWNKKNYWIHLGFLDTMMQEGYQPRTKSNRVRCVRKL